VQIYRDETDGTRWSGLGAEAATEDCGWCGGSALLGARDAVYTSAPVADPTGVWRHAVRLTYDSRTVLTQGNYEVTQLLGWDDRRKLL
jgi:hypothetical protein